MISWLCNEVRYGANEVRYGANKSLQQTGAALRFFGVHRFLSGPGC